MMRIHAEVVIEHDNGEYTRTATPKYEFTCMATHDDLIRETESIVTTMGSKMIHHLRYWKPAKCAVFLADKEGNYDQVPIGDSYELISFGEAKEFWRSLKMGAIRDWPSNGIYIIRALDEESWVDL